MRNKFLRTTMNLSEKNIDKLETSVKNNNSKNEKDVLSESNYPMSLLSTRDTFTVKKQVRSMSSKSLKFQSVISNNDHICSDSKVKNIKSKCPKYRRENLLNNDVLSKQSSNNEKRYDFEQTGNVVVNLFSIKDLNLPIKTKNDIDKDSPIQPFDKQLGRKPL